MRAAAPLLGLVLAGCAAIYPAGGQGILCQIGADGGGDPCLAIQQRCRAGHCEPCPEDEACNGRDDDCDGRIDEDASGEEVCNRVDDDCDANIDEGIDQDADGHDGCAPGAPDCDDADPAVHPGVSAEECDGRDQNCDGMIDLPIAGEELCDPGLTCIPARGGCVMPNCAYPESPRCSEGFVCNPVTGTCAPGDDCTLTGCTGSAICDAQTRRCVTRSPLGSVCSTDLECESEHCYDAREALAITPLPGGPGICGLPCCDDGACPSGFVCWAPGTGARSCVARSLLEAGANGAPAVAACATDDDCGARACRLQTMPAYDRAEHAMLGCGATTVTRAGGSCSDDDECRSGLCLPLYVGWFEPDYGPCTGGCRRDGDCDVLEDRFAADRGINVDLVCGQARWVPTDQRIQVCVPPPAGGRGPGSGCTADSECSSGVCLAGQCRALCCESADCGVSQHCRASFRGGRWRMHCAPVP